MPYVSAPLLAAGSSTFNPGISEKQGGVTHTQLSDRLGTLKGTTNSSQSVTSTKQFDAFGNLTSSSGIASLKGFAGDWGYQEDENGLKQVGHRLYDPSLGRFLTRDPIGSGLNWYAYCGNNPTKAVDPYGLDYIIISTDDGAEGNGAHARIGIWNGSSAQGVVWYGFYPKGVKRNDDPRNGTKGKDVFIQVTAQQRRQIEKKLLEEIQRTESGQKPSYSLRNKNCAQFLSQILRDVLDPSSAEQRLDIQTPEALIAWLERYGSREVPEQWRKLNPKDWPSKKAPWRLPQTKSETVRL